MNEEDHKKYDVLDVNQPDGTEAANSKPQRPIAPQQSGGFLDDFLAAVDSGSTGDTVDEKIADTPEPPKTADELRERVIDVLRDIYDPEIPVNIYELGLIYAVDIADDWRVTIKMTLTSPHCPVAETMPGEVEVRANAVEGTNGVVVELVWEPAWSMDLMSDEARLELGML